MTSSGIMEILGIGLESKVGLLHSFSMTTTLPEFLTHKNESADANAEVLREVERIIRLRTGGTIRELRVVLEEDEVVITGRTSTYYNRQLATHAMLAGFQDGKWRNEIDVNP